MDCVFSFLLICLLDEDGNCKYSHLVNLALSREDSQFKQLLERHSNNIQEDTLESIRIVKDFLVQSGDLESIEVTTHMIDTCKGSYSLYKKYLKDKKQESNCQKAKEEGRIEQFSY